MNRVPKYLAAFGGGPDVSVGMVRSWGRGARPVASRVSGFFTAGISGGDRDVRSIMVWAGLLGLQRTVVEDVTTGSEGEVIVAVRPGWRDRDRCGLCRRRCGRYDAGQGRRRWRALDLATTFCFLEADAPRVRCRRHGVVVAAVPWARHDSRFTRSFEDQVAWLAVNTSKTAVAELMRVAWRSVGQILERAAVEQRAKVDLLDGLRRVGIETECS